MAEDTVTGTPAELCGDPLGEEQRNTSRELVRASVHPVPGELSGRYRSVMYGSPASGGGRSRTGLSEALQLGGWRRRRPLQDAPLAAGVGGRRLPVRRSQLARVAALRHQTVLDQLGVVLHQVGDHEGLQGGETGLVMKRK